MNSESIALLRATNQQITGSGFRTAKEIARWMGAIQAQDLIMSKWAFGLRLQGSTREMIDTEIDSGSIIRTHLLRPTWHFVSNEDVLWILGLSASRIRAAAHFMDSRLGLTESIFRKSNKIIEKTLLNNDHLTREELTRELVKSGVSIYDNRASHLFMRAETEGLICSGRHKNGKPTYALLEHRIPGNALKLSKEDSLKELGRRYFTSHGPATSSDFSWWSGLSASDTRTAIELNKADFAREVIGDQVYWFKEISSFSTGTDEIYMLPAYDEFLISYRDRKASLELAEKKNIVSANGIFYPSLVRNGQVIGTWKRNIRKENAEISVVLLKGLSASAPALRKAVNRYSGFIQKPAVIKQIVVHPRRS